MDSRTGLLSAALALFSSRGFDSVGVQEVALAAGLTKPTLYHFFGSKGGLLEAIFDEYAAGLDAAVTEAVSDDSVDLAATLERVAAAFFDYSAAEPMAYRLELALYFTPRENPAHAVATAHYLRRYVVLENVFVRAAKDYPALSLRHKLHAVAFIGVLNSFIGLQVNGELRIDSALRREIVERFVHGIL